MGLRDNVTIADGQSRNKGKIQHICKRHLFHKGYRNSTGLPSLTWNSLTTLDPTTCSGGMP
jgi:hypothetical protein